VKRQVETDNFSLEKSKGKYSLSEYIKNQCLKLFSTLPCSGSKIALLTKKFFFLFLVVLNSGHTLFSQTYSSRNNYTGDWELPATWNTMWNHPQTTLTGNNIIINGYITANGNLTFSGSASKLIINDTLVIKGDLTLGNNNDLTINDNGILIIRGAFTTGNQSVIIANGYLVVTSDFTKNGSVIQGLINSNDNPVKVFICGSISPPELTDNIPLFSAINCSTPLTNRYQNSNCSYGNLTDLTNDPIYSFFQTTCIAPAPSVTASGPTVFCYGGSVALSSTIATSYLWSTGATSQSIDINSPGIYSVKVTNAAGCLSVPSPAIVVKVNALPVTPTITASGPTSFCVGRNVTLTSTKGSYYLWSNGATGSSINVNTSGTYYVSIVDLNGCQSAQSLPTSVTVNAVPAPTIIASGPTTICSGSDVTLTSSSGTSYLWSNAATTTSINVNSAGNYSVQITDANGCQSVSSSPSVVKINPLPLVNAGIDATIPYGTNTTINATITGTGPFTYNWSPAGKLVNALIEDPGTVNLISTTAFTLTATSVTTSCSASDEVTIAISGGPLNTLPSASLSSVCSGTPVQLHALAGGGSGSYTYTWTSVPAGFTSSLANPLVNPSVTTTYKVSVYDGFNTVNAQVIVTVNPLPSTPVITSDGPLTFCAGGSVNLTSSASANYLWSNDANTQTINVTASGVYTVQTINSNGCYSVQSLPVTIIANAVPLRPTITADGPSSFCQGESVNLTSSPASSYQWSDSESTQIINIINSGSYTVQVKNSNGCQSIPSLPFSVYVNAPPTPPDIKADGPTTFCAGGAVNLSSTTASGYLWSNGATTQVVNVNSPGIYTVQVSNANGCQSSPSAATTVKINPLPKTPAITASGPLTFCSGGSVTLTSSAGTSYLWSNGATSSSITVDFEDQYTVQDINSEGCLSMPSSPAEVIVHKAPVAAAGPDQILNFAFNAQMEASLSDMETGEWSLISGSGNINDPHSPTARISGLKTGDNIFLWTVKNTFCETSKEIKITVKDEFVPSVITPNGDGKNDNFRIGEYSGKVELIILNQWGSLEYSNNNYLNEWDGRNNKGSDLPAGTYFYILKFDNGKVLKGSVLIKK
jgi:gliding motility-associated-like protein